MCMKTRSSDESAVVAEIAVGDEPGEGINVIAHHDGLAWPLRTRQMFLAVFSNGSGALSVLGAEVLDELGIVHDP